MIVCLEGWGLTITQRPLNRLASYFIGFPRSSDHSNAAQHSDWIYVFLRMPVIYLDMAWFLSSGQISCEIGGKTDFDCEAVSNLRSKLSEVGSIQLTPRLVAG